MLRNCEEIVKRGEFLGQGLYGAAYLIDGLVYKIMHRQHEVDSYTDPNRIARIWNEFFTNAYAGKLSHLAKARPLILNDGKWVLITPFVEGKIPDASNYDRSILSKELQKMGRYMQDNSHENVRIVQGMVVPIDFDMVVWTKRKQSAGSDSAIKFLGLGK
ncbi:MAG: hypothetical protein KIT56_09090, partial [Gammaproteobacteria bacterium]|nr:hypothetical protein [Gammaproteobacteria bacterium]